MTPRILLVEDDYNLGFVIQDKLKENGFEGRVVPDHVGKEADVHFVRI